VLRPALASVVLLVSATAVSTTTAAADDLFAAQPSANLTPRETSSAAVVSLAGRPDPPGPRAEAALTRRLVIGHSVRGRAIVAYRKGDPSADRRVVVVGQMHGDETAGVRTARYIKNHVPVSRGSVLWVVPTMNPDGLAAGTRRNARNVDLNRNWPTRWVPGDGAGARALSEPETRAMYRFLKRIQPRFIVSLHQPFGVVSRSDKNMAFVRRLSAQLRLPIERVQIGDCHGPDCPPVPTMTSWYNTRQPGYCVTVEFGPHPSSRFLTARAGPGILRAMLSWRAPGAL
jgi:protein MpaA